MIVQYLSSFGSTQDNPTHYQCLIFNGCENCCSWTYSHFVGGHVHWTAEFRAAKFKFDYTIVRLVNSNDTILLTIEELFLDCYQPPDLSK